MIKYISCLILALFMLTVVSCSKKESAPPNMPRPAHTSLAIKADVPIYINTIGVLTASQSVDVKSQVTGKIVSTLFTEGQFVKKGDLLFEVDSRIYEATINEAKSILRQNVADAKIAQWLVEKDKKLFETKAMSTQDYANLVTTLEKASGRVQSAQAVIDKNSIELDYCTIESPIDGIVGARKVDPGNVIVADSGPTLVNIKTVDPVYVDFTIPERNYSLLRDSMNKGQLKVIVETETLDSLGQIKDKIFTGTLNFLDNSINPATGTISLRASIPNPDKELWPGQFVQVKLIYFVQKDALLVPGQAVTMGLKGNYVYAVKDGKAILCWVKKGLSQGDYVMIDGFIDENKFTVGDKVITVGQGGIAPNSLIREVTTDTFTLSSEIYTPDSSSEKQ